MALISIVPRPAASAMAVPLMPAKITEPTTLTCPRPPLSQPTSDSAKLKMRFVMPALFIRLPARMKKGTASSGKLSMPPIMRWTTTKGGTSPL